MRSVKLSTIAAALLLSGCRAAPVPPSITRSEAVAAVSARVDTVIIRDSVSTERRGDTVYVGRWRDRWRVKVSADTVRVERVDTVRVAAPSPAPAAERAGGATGVIKWLVVLVIAACLFVFLTKK